MGNPLRDRRAAAEWASAQQVIEIAEDIVSFDDFAAAIGEDLAALPAEKVPAAWRQDTVCGELRFAQLDVDGRVPGVSGRLSTTVHAVCQRCLEVFRLSLDVELKLLLLAVDEMVVGFDEFEVWELDDQMLRPSDLVSELLVMALPFAAMHDNAAECAALTSPSGGEKQDTTRPFAALRRQMDQN